MTIEIRRLEGERHVIVQQQLKSWQVFGYIGATCVLTGEGHSEEHALRIAKSFEKTIDQRR